MAVKIVCKWDGKSMHAPKPDAIGPHEIRLAAAVLMGAGEGSLEKAIELLKKHAGQREQICP